METSSFEPLGNGVDDPHGVPRPPGSVSTQLRNKTQYRRTLATKFVAVNADAFPGRDPARSAASQSRDRSNLGAWNDPGSAAHRP
jgi:hypothetical protein